MKKFSFLVFSLFFSVSAAGSDDVSNRAKAVDAVLELTKNSLAAGQDKIQVLKNAMLLLTELNADNQMFSNLADLWITAEKTIDKGLTCAAEDAEDIFLSYADRHIRRMEQAVNDYDCMEREFDVSDPNFDSAEAAIVFGKCRVLVLRNVFPKTTMQEYRRKYDDYVYAVHTGKVNRFNTKTTDSMARDIVQDRGRKRHDIILPKWLAGEEFTHNPHILEIMKHEHVLGKDMFLNHLGSVVSEPGAPSMHWHHDAGYVWSPDSFDWSGIGGQDLPPYAVSMFVPLFANVTYDHGPTEFCIGSGHMSGIPKTVSVLDATLVGEGSTYEKMQEFKDTAGACPPGHWRVPLADMGDAILFDYQIQHRGGANKSPDSRALLFALYTRWWFRDGNFDNTYADSESSNEEHDDWAAGMRYALVNESDIEHTPEATATVASLKNFAGIVAENEDTTGSTVEFLFTNNNVEDAIIFYDGGPKEKIQPMEQWLLTGEVGQRLLAHDKNGNPIDSWIITTDQSETVLVDRRHNL